MTYRGFYSEDEYLDARAEAREEAWYEAHPTNMTCEACGCQWYSPIIRSRLNPPEPRFPDCPSCGS